MTLPAIIFFGFVIAVILIIGVAAILEEIYVNQPKRNYYAR